MKDAFLATMKFLLFVLVVPIVAAVTTSLYAQVAGLHDLALFFVWGMATYVVVHLFLFAPLAMYQGIQNAVAKCFQFVPVVGPVIPRLVPVVVILPLLAYYTGHKLMHQDWPKDVFVFVAGLTLAMHLTLTAKELHDADAQPLKAHYLLVMSFYYIFNLVLVFLVLALCFSKISVYEFFHAGFGQAKEIYIFVYQRIFERG